ncbi:MAG: hypothetical protein JW910_18990 [Anaerolineae bacterium]|nr:hypothetical protein [Anaerolineae bacterium]
MFKNPHLNKLVYAAAFVLTVAVLLSLPYGPLSWQALAQSYLYDEAPLAVPMAEITGITFVTQEEVFLPGTRAELDEGGLILADQDDAGAVTIYAGGIQALLDPSLLANTFRTRLASGEMREYAPDESSAANLNDRLMLTGTSSGVTINIYYLYTAEGTRAFQITLLTNDTLLSNRLLLFAEADGVLTWVVRSE